MTRQFVLVIVLIAASVASAEANPIVPVGIAVTPTPFGEGWTQFQSGGFFPTYSIAPTVAHLVTVSLSDGSVATFAPQLSPETQILFPIDFTTIGFVPVPPTTFGTLTLLQHGDVVVSASVGPVTLLDFDTLMPFNPTEFLLMRTVDGATFHLTVGGDVTAVPEPATGILMFSGFVAAVRHARRRRK